MSCQQHWDISGQLADLSVIGFYVLATTKTGQCAVHNNRSPQDNEQTKLQAMVYDILPSTTAVFSSAIGSRKLSANKPFFVGAQTVVSLLQTTQIISDICFITDHVAYASSNKPKIV